MFVLELVQFDRYAQCLGHGQKLTRRLLRRLKLLRWILQGIARQINGKLRAVRQKLRQNFTLNAVEICKSIKIKVLSRGKITRFQRCQQTIQTRLRVLSAVGTDAGIALHQERKFLGLDGKHAGKLLRGVPKGFRCDAIAAKLLERVDQAQQKFRLRRCACKHLQP